MFSLPTYEYDSYLHFLLEPNHNGFSMFLVGGLFILSIYHSILYIQSKDKSYFYYAIYTFLLFLTYSTMNPNSFLGVLFKDYSIYMKDYKLMLIWLYNTVYFSFGLTFINLKKHNYKWYKIILIGVYSLLIFGILIQILSDISGNADIIKTVYSLFFLPTISVFSLLSFWVALKIKSKLTFYLIVGSSFLLCSSLLATLIIDVKVINNIYDIGTLVFYIGLIIENIFFSIGLGFKQKLILIEKNKALSNALENYKQNQDLKKKLNIELNEKVEILEDKIKSDIENNELKLTVFKSQINPHFIFNSLNTLKFLIVKKDLDNAVIYLVKFSRLLRSTLENSVKKNVTLEEELTFLKLYIYLENLRFKDSINYTCTISKMIDVYTIFLPPLILQPIIENSIWHGLTSKVGEKKIQIDLNYISKNKLRISIEDNGVGRSFSKNKPNQKSFGIQLTKERLYTFDKEASFKMIDLVDNKARPTGTKTVIEIHIPHFTHE